MQAVEQQSRNRGAIAMAKPNVTTKRIIKLYAKHQSFAKVARIVKRHATAVRARLIRAKVVSGICE
jgi:hypothetical protein